MWAFLPLLALLPFTALALAIIWLPLGLLFDVPYWSVLAAYGATGPLLFFRPFQVAVLTPVLGARAPSSAEAETITPLWDEVRRVAGRDHHLPEDRYVLRILPSDELNAFACGGHLVVVTSFAVERLPTRELRGVLAHELSHHIGRHTIATTVGHWLSAPTVLLARIGFYLDRVGQASAASFGRRRRGVELLSRAGAALMRLVGQLFSGGLLIADSLTNLVGHDAEFEADRRAVAMGFGSELADALRRLLHLESGLRRTGWRARLAASHPPARVRVARIDALLRHPAR